MPKPAPRRRAASMFLPTMATASTHSARRTASRCTRPMKPVPKIAVLTDCIFLVLNLGPPGGRRLLTNDDAVKEVGRLGQTLLRREQAVFVLDGKNVIIAKHAQRGD